MSRILVVDDDPDYGFALRSLLASGGHQTDIAHQGAEALTLARSTCFDVAFLDLSLPDVDGLALLEQVGRIDPHLPIICLSGRGETSTVVQAMRKGAVDYLTKPVGQQTLLSAVASASEYSAARRSGAAQTQGVAVPVGSAPKWKRAIELVMAAAAAPRTTVLLTGEPGVGKEVAASLLHRLSKRSEAAMVSANAACFSPSLMESELFGHEAGAFTGATRRRKGLFEQADRGVLFLDEIGELPLDLQGKLLRVLEGHPFRRLGGEESVEVDVRLVAATNRDLPSLVKEGSFRADLYERLRVFEIGLPPLRERRDDIAHLVCHFLAKLGPELGARTTNISPEALDALTRHDWPGNVRELRNVVERALVLSGGATLSVQHLPHQLWASGGSLPAATAPDEALALDGPDVRLEHVERRHITAVFSQTDHNITRAAERLGISRLALRKRLQAYGLRPVRS